MEEESYTFKSGLLTGGMIAIGIIAILNFFNGGKYKIIPNRSEVQSGYVIPSKLEIQLQDLDGNGEDESLMRYDGKSYLLRLDEQGRPKVQSYEIRPSELIIRE